MTFFIIMIDMIVNFVTSIVKGIWNFICTQVDNIKNFLFVEHKEELLWTILYLIVIYICIRIYRKKILSFKRMRIMHKINNSDIVIHTDYKEQMKDGKYDYKFDGKMINKTNKLSLKKEILLDSLEEKFIPDTLVSIKNAEEYKKD